MLFRGNVFARPGLEEKHTVRRRHSFGPATDGRKRDT